MQLYYLYVVLAATILVPVSIGILHLSRFSPGLLAFVSLLILGAVTETVMISLAGFGIRNLFILHVFAVAELCLLYIFYRQSLRSRYVRRWMGYGLVAVLTTAIVYGFCGNNLHNFNSLPRALESVFIIFLAVTYFYESATAGDSQDPFRDGCFFMNGGILFYFSANFIIFSVSRYAGGEQLFIMYAVHSFVNGFCNLVFAYGLWIKTSSPSFFAAR